MHLIQHTTQLLEQEVYVWSKLKHENLLPLVGYAFDVENGHPMLVSEWMENGSAWVYARETLQCDLLRLVTGIARGLAYLHERDIVHSDIKSDNVLVSDSGDARICDFGYTRMIDASKSLVNLSTGIKGTPQYLAYELLADPSKYTKHSKESDVWAFGITVFVSNSSK
ncbi:kinase-like protein [Fomitiporia mediterranea MF3/22]|uniref:kinase-like protein n=1 Tax=Fomitiporia mediterranea (strain MF3/22) TaxID=694068 RepID=UPI0004409A60|nr:kinase-like protein [Fomitiporia mediterranea MF3/22]EJC98173.1 kinase-like protein [Fomitiporia mediterranea MF3/22]